MKFRLLNCFLFAVACIVGTCCVPVWADDEVTCGDGQYLDNAECKDCPAKDKVGNQCSGVVACGGRVYNYTNYYFGQSGEGITSCTVKLNVEESKCNTGTNVVYRYDDAESKYVLDAENYTVVPDADFYKLYESADVVPAGLPVDHCGTCASFAGTYIENNTCKSCPVEGTNVEGKVGTGQRFQFIEYGEDDSKGIGVTSCAVKLKADKDGCGIASYVVYVYNGSEYVRAKGSYALPTGTSVLSGNGDLENSFCIECASGLYNVNGTCGSCNEPGLYLEITQVIGIKCAIGGECPTESVCKTCPAGYYCPGDTSKESCPENTYSESGAGECKACAPGYSTASSGPISDGYDGLCLDVGSSCISLDACKLVKSSLYLSRLGESFYLGDNIKIESLNGSVVKTFQSANPATNPSGRPVDWFDDDE